MTTKTVTIVSRSEAVTGDDCGEGGILDSQSRNLIRSLWNKAKSNTSVAPSFLFRLFAEIITSRIKALINFMFAFVQSFPQAQPEYQKKFSQFADVPMSDLIKNGNFLVQSYIILAGLNECHGQQGQLV